MISFHEKSILFIFCQEKPFKQQKEDLWASSTEIVLPYVKWSMHPAGRVISL